MMKLSHVFGGECVYHWTAQTVPAQKQVHERYLLCSEELLLQIYELIGPS